MRFSGLEFSLTQNQRSPKLHVLSDQNFNIQHSHHRDYIRESLFNIKTIKFFLLTKIYAVYIFFILFVCLIKSHSELLNLVNFVNLIEA